MSVFAFQLITSDLIRLLSQYHPDKNPSPDAEEKFKEIRHDTPSPFFPPALFSLIVVLQLARRIECSQILYVGGPLSSPNAAGPRTRADAVSWPCWVLRLCRLERSRS